ncbi:MAG: hypothetical protein KDE48_18240 [Anaerolineales bacterium]|nr:hypothetical protein [Anaerolineales bacterium]
MPYTIKETRTYSQTSAQVFAAAQKAVTGLQGKILQEDAGTGTIKGQFDKKIHGKVLGDRSEIIVTISAAEAETSISTEVYPINPVGQKLMFGARKGVSQTVNGWFWAHLEHHLG